MQTGIHIICALKKVSPMHVIVNQTFSCNKQKGWNEMLPFNFIKRRRDNLLFIIYETKLSTRYLTTREHEENPILPGTLVPKATKAMAVIVSRNPIVHPTCEAQSPIKAVTRPMPRIDNTNVG